MARDHEESEGQLEGDCPVKIEPGVYNLAFQFHRTLYLFGRAPKLYCYFKITDPGKYYGITVIRYYNVKTLNSKPRKGGSFRIGYHSDLMREYVTLFGWPARKDRISTRAFELVIVRGRIRTVTHDAKQRLIPEPLQYSVIAELIGRET